MPFLDRAIPLAVAERLDVPVDDAVTHDDQASPGRLERLLRGTARRAMRATDHAHADYVRRFYGADLADPSLYHVVLDATAIDLAAAVDILAAAGASVTPISSHRFRRD